MPPLRSESIRFADVDAAENRGAGESVGQQIGDILGQGNRSDRLGRSRIDQAERPAEIGERRAAGGSFGGAEDEIGVEVAERDQAGPFGKVEDHRSARAEILQRARRRGSHQLDIVQRAGRPGDRIVGRESRAGGSRSGNGSEHESPKRGDAKPLTMGHHFIFLVGREFAKTVMARLRTDPQWRQGAFFRTKFGLISSRRDGQSESAAHKTARGCRAPGLRTRGCEQNRVSAVAESKPPPRPPKTRNRG